MAESLTMALARRIGRPAAQGIVAEICRQAESSERTVKETALGEPRVTDHLGKAELDRAFDPERYLGSTAAFIQQSLESFRRSRAGRAQS